MCSRKVSSARLRLNTTLQNLVEKDEESYTPSESNSPKSHDETPHRLPSPQQSPKKATFSKVSRKRKRKEDSSGSDINQYHYTYVMKLFDRSVDLAQFNENTPLYPICRAWIKNQPHNHSNQERSPSPDSDIDVKDKNIHKNGNIYHLPPPIKSEKDQCSKPRIPSPLPQTNTRIDIYADPDKAPHPKELLSNHMARWKKVRNRWRETSRQNELRYSPSLIILKEMFDSQCKDS